MGNLLKKFKNEIHESTDNQEYYVDINKIPKNDFLCPKCFKTPIISNICYDNGIIKLKCEVHGELILTIKQFYEEIYNSKFHNYNKKCDCKKNYDKDSIFYYSNQLHKYFCTNCIANNLEGHENDFIDINDEKIKNYQKSHKKKSKEDLEKLKKPIMEENKKLSKIYRLNQIILNTYKKYPNNYFHIQSVKKLGESIYNESKELESSYEELNSKIEENKNNNELNTFKNDHNINDEDERLILPGKNLGDNGFETISQIVFTKLIEIDLSKNNIANIKCLDNMILPYLKILDMSDNQIEDITPISELNCKNLKVINLQKNKITDIEPFLHSDFPKLLILKIEENNIKQDEKSFEDLQKKYNKQLNYKKFTDKEFAQKYGVDNINKKILDLHNKRNAEMLKHLYLVLSNHKNNIIQELKLDDNELCDVSILSIFPLPNLNILDLSVNKIKNLDFLNEMEIPKIKIIYLNENEFYDIRQLRYLVNKKEKKKENENENEQKYNIKMFSLKNDNFKKLFKKIKRATSKDKIIIKKNNQNIKTLEEFKTSEILMDLDEELDEIKDK